MLRGVLTTPLLMLQHRSKYLLNICMFKVNKKGITTTSMVVLLLLLFTLKKYFHTETLVDVDKIS